MYVFHDPEPLPSDWLEYIDWPETPDDVTPLQIARGYECLEASHAQLSHDALAIFGVERLVDIPLSEYPRLMRVFWVLQSWYDCVDDWNDMNYEMGKAEVLDATPEEREAMAEELARGRAEAQRKDAERRAESAATQIEGAAV